MRPRSGGDPRRFGNGAWPWPWLVFGMLVCTPASGAGGAEVDYLRDVKPILKQRCYACHGVLKRRAGLRLDTARAAIKGGDFGPAVEPDHPDDSTLIDRVTQPDPKLRMPPEGAPLSAEQVATLRAWIERGARAPVGEPPEEDPRQHWSFVKPERPPIPATRNDGWVRNPIDAFLAAEHDRRGLRPAPPADPANLLRRIHLDLTGLPPTRSELREFLRDPSDQSYERVVARLLASPAYGERWARHWMDVWRYSDWYGRRAVPDVTNSYAMIWRWRDWIVGSLNDDRGYDRMVSLMLAADELAPDSETEVVATGFVLRNFYRWNYNTWMKDAVEHTAKAFLGLTLQCAHCHDHKYDPLTQNDYFAFRAFFEPLEVRHDRVAGEPDPGPYPKYVYGSSYKPINSGSARVFDEKLDAKTFLYTRGESRNIVPGRPPVESSVPAFLRPKDFRVSPIDLPAEAAHPALKSFARREELQLCDAALMASKTAHSESLKPIAQAESARIAAEMAWNLSASPPAFAGRADIPAFAPAAPIPPTVQKARDAFETFLSAERLAANQVDLARAKREALRARIAADLARFAHGPGDLKTLARAASKAERMVLVEQAKVDLSRAEQALSLARQKASHDPKARPAVAQAETQKIGAVKKRADAAAMLANESETYAALGPVYPSQSTGRRSALARWVASRENPLTARVAVNHLWRWHFLTPIVATTHDFGRNGKRPTNPALLDWLAVELMEPSTPGAAPWSLKHLHRLIVTSAAYRMRSEVGAPDARNQKADPANVALWRFPSARMEAEVVRDSLLHTAGALDTTFGGPDIDYGQGLTSRRRSLYFTHHGEARMPFLELFDAADACDAYVRTVSVVPQQALALTNNALCRSLSHTVASNLWNELAEAGVAGASRFSTFVSAAFEQVLGRAPGSRELSVSIDFLTRQTRLLSSDPPPDAEAASHARDDLVQALFSHNDFVTIH